MRERKYVDIHCHGLFGIDDGAASFDETKELLAMADRENIDTVIFTPHYSAFHRENKLEQTLSHFKIVKDYCQEHRPQMKLHLGNEIFYSRSVVDQLECGKALTLAGSRYVLIEFAVDASFEYIYEAVRTLSCSGFWPVIAHTERYDDLFCRRGNLEELIEAGAYLQVNSRSFLGGRLDGRRRRAIKMLKEGVVHFVADDSHNCQRRSPLMKQVFDELSVKFDRQMLDKIFYENPQKLLSDDFV